MPRNYKPTPLTAGRAPRDDERTRDRKVGLAVINSTQPVGKKDARLYRAWADTNEWIRAAINHRKTQVSQAKYDIVAIDPEGPVDEAMRTRILSVFSKPNGKTDSFRGLIEPVVEDILVLDGGSTEIVRNLKGFPAQLWQVDGAQIRLDPLWTGEDPNKPRYFWYPQGTNSVQLPTTSGLGVGLLDSELMYMMMNPATWRVVGFSPLETLREVVESEIMASRYNKRQVSEAPPHGIVDLGEDATPENVNQFERYWRTEIAGSKSTGVIGGTKNAKFHPFGKSNRDMQFLQWQTYLIRKITAVFGISPQDLGVTFDVNRANAQEQGNISEDRGLKPLLNMMESQFNREVVQEFARVSAKQKYWRGDFTVKQMQTAVALSYLDPRLHPEVFAKNKDANTFNLMFHFKVPSARSVTTRALIHGKELGGLPWQVINAVRAEELLPPVEGGDTIILNTPMGPLRLSTVTGETLPSTAEKAFMDYAFANPAMRLQSQQAAPTE